MAQAKARIWLICSKFAGQRGGGGRAREEREPEGSVGGGSGVEDPQKSTASGRRGENLNSFNDVRTENGSSQGQNLALNGLFVPSRLHSVLAVIFVY